MNDLDTTVIIGNAILARHRSEATEQKAETQRLDNRTARRKIRTWGSVFIGVNANDRRLATSVVEFGSSECVKNRTALDIL